jgi:hypothetical protein
MNFFSTAILVLALFVGISHGTPISCTGHARALEMDEESVLSNDPCGGRVCEETCPCGQTVYFNLEGLISHGGAAAYSSICVNERYSQVPPGDNFVFNELKSSLAACGYKEYANLKSFSSMAEYVYRFSFTPGRDGGTRRSYPPNALLSFAIALKGFAKECRESGNWENDLHSKLDLKEKDAKKAAAAERAPNCIYQQLQNMKNKFAQNVVDSKRVYCKCSRLLEHKTYSNYKYVYPFKKYQQNIDEECQKKCSSAIILEYVEE